MGWAANLLLQFLALGVLKAVVEPLAQATIDLPLQKVKPLIYDQLDRVLPQMMWRGSGEAVRHEIEEVVARTTGEEDERRIKRWAKQVEEGYSPVKAAEKYGNAFVCPACGRPA